MLGGRISRSSLRTRELAALARLRALRDLDLELLRVDEVLLRRGRIKHPQTIAPSFFLIVFFSVSVCCFWLLLAVSGAPFGPRVCIHNGIIYSYAH